MKCDQCGANLGFGDRVRVMGNPKWPSSQVLVHESHMQAWQDDKDGLAFDCPQCRTTGKIDSGETEEYERPLRQDESPLCSWDGCRGCGQCRNNTATDTRPIRVTCPLCKGRGKLAQKPEPVREIVAWRLP